MFWLEITTTSSDADPLSMNVTVMHRSNAVLVTDEEKVQAVIDGWEEDHPLEGSYEIGGGRVAFFGMTTFGVGHSPENDDRIREFLRDVQELIDGVLVIREISYEGVRYIPEAGQWVVTPEKIYYEDLPGPGELDLDGEEIVEAS